MSKFTHVKHGLYRLSEGESPREVAEKVYGDSSRYQILLKYNDDWGTEEVITVPNKEGRITKVEEGDSLDSTIKRMFPNQPPHLYDRRYLVWNAGILPQDLVGENIFIPER